MTWSIGESPGNVRDVVATGGLLVAVGTAGTTADSGDVAAVWTSRDGRIWEPAEVPEPAGTITAVASRSGRLVAVGTVATGTSGPAAWTSVDGRTWQRLPASAFAVSAGRDAGPLLGVAAGPGGFVAVGSEVGAGGSRATAWQSPDGLTWTRTGSELGGDSAGAVVRFGAGFVAAGWAPGTEGDDRALFWTSADGRTWVAAPDEPALHDVGATPRLAAASHYLVAFGGRSHAFVLSEATVWTSQNGRTWQREASSGVAAPLPSVAPMPSGQTFVGLGIGALIGTDGGFIADGESLVLGPASAAGNGRPIGRRVVWTSRTGATWTLAADLPAADGGSDPGMVGPLVVDQGRLLVFGIPLGGGPAPLWETGVQGILDQAR